MTEDEWLACTFVPNMLACLEGRLSDRKSRLFAVACCRLLSREWVKEPSRKAVDVAERYADGNATGLELAEARGGAPSSYREWLYNGMPYQDEYAASAAAQAASESLNLDTFYSDVFYSTDMTEEEDGDEVAAFLFRDIFSNFFRPAVIQQAWLTTGVVAIARSIYDRREFAKLPILADELEQAGCVDAAILGHCRGVTPHVRGCWALDLILGKG